MLGRPWPEPGEPLWLDLDVEKALSLVRWRRSHCDGCGQLLADWFGPDGKELRDPLWEVVATKRPCCEMLAMARDEDPLLKQPGMHATFRRVPDLTSDEPASDET